MASPKTEMKINRVPETNHLGIEIFRSSDEVFKIAVLREFNELERKIQKQFHILTEWIVRWK